MANTYDPDADKRNAPIADGSTAYTPNQLKDFEERFANMPEEDKEALRSSVQKVQDGEDLSEQEAAAYQKYLGTNTAPGEFIGWKGKPVELDEDKLNKGYTGKEGEKKTLTSRMAHSNSKLKKKIAVAGAAAGGSVVVGIIVFLALLPLKIQHIITNLENHFSAASNQAIDTEMQNFYSEYVKKNVLPYINRNGCRTTVNANCVYGTEGKGAVGKLYAAWTQGRLEQKMATNYGIVISRSGTGAGYRLTVHGQDFKIGSDHDIFNIEGSHNVSTNQARREIRAAVKTGLKDATLYDKVFFRFKLNKFLEAKYGIRRCLGKCTLRDNWGDWKTNKKQAYQVYLIQRVISPMSDSYGLILQCLIGGDNACPSTDPEKAGAPDENGNQERTSKVEQAIQANLAAYAAKFATEEAGKEAVDKLIANAHDISENGLTKVLASKVLSKVFGTEVTSEVVDKVGGPISWIKSVANAINKAKNIGQEARDIDYAAESAEAVQFATTFETVAEQAKAGQVDAEVLGSFTNQLGTAAKDANGNAADATASPLYKSITGDGSSSSAYKCDDNKPVGNKLICPEEDLAKGSGTADEISNFVNSIPLLGDVASVVSDIESFPPVKILSDLLDGVSNFIVNHIPGVSDAADYAGKLAEPLVNLVVSKLMPSVINTTMSGARATDMLAAGFDVSQNASTMTQLGGGVVSAAAMNKIQNEQLAEEKYEFQNQSMFARLFSTDSSYSLVSRLAMDMPTNLLTATNDGVASLLTSPVGKVGGLFSSVFSGKSAFAQTTPQADPFHVPQIALTDLPSAPDDYWDQHCVNGDMGKYDESSDTLDISDWLNADGNTGKDPNTGQSVNLKENPCPLIHSILQTGGATFDPSTLPKSATSNTSSAAPTTTSTAGENPSKPTIVIDPGHSGTTNSVIDQATGLTDYDYANHPEMEDVFDVAQLVQTKLQTDGYNVLLTKQKASDTVTFRQRADIANNAHAALAISIHDQATKPGYSSGGLPFASANNYVYPQRTNAYRRLSTKSGGPDPTGKKIIFSDVHTDADSIANLSQKYANIFAKDRSAAEGHTVTVASSALTQSQIGTRLPSIGDMWMVQLFSDVPWIYNEAGGDSSGQHGLSNADKQKYANGLIKSIEDAVPVDSASTAASDLPVSQDPGNATQVITVKANSTSSTTATLEEWDKTGDTWTKHGSSIKAYVGTQGLTKTPSESVSATPIGSFTLTQAFGSQPNPGTDLHYKKTDQNSYWISQYGGKCVSTYNTFQETSKPCVSGSGSKNEHLVAVQPEYRYALVIDANTKNAPGGVKQGGGSAFFLHVSDGGPTAGCVSIPESDLVSLMKWMKASSNPRILIDAGT